MSDAVTKDDLIKLSDSIDKRFDQLMVTLNRFAENTDKRFNKIEAHLDRHDEELRKLNEKYNHLVDTIDGFISRIDHYEIEMAAQKQQTHMPNTPMA